MMVSWRPQEAHRIADFVSNTLRGGGGGIVPSSPIASDSPVHTPVDIPQAMLCSEECFAADKIVFAPIGAHPHLQLV